MLSSGTCYHLGRNDSCGANVIIWDEMIHVELMFSSGTKCYHLGAKVIIWELMLPSGTNVIIWSYCYHLELMLSSGVNVIIWCDHVMLSSGMITPPFFIFPENFIHSVKADERD
jgi:hypothetical protein